LKRRRFRAVSSSIWATCSNADQQAIPLDAASRGASPGRRVFCAVLFTGAPDYPIAGLPSCLEPGKARLSADDTAAHLHERTLQQVFSVADRSSPAREMAYDVAPIVQSSRWQCGHCHKRSLMADGSTSLAGRHGHRSHARLAGSWRCRWPAPGRISLFWQRVRWRSRRRGDPRTRRRAVSFQPTSSARRSGRRRAACDRESAISTFCLHAGIGVRGADLAKHIQDFRDWFRCERAGVMLAIRAVLPSMIARRSGRIVVIGGSYGIRRSPISHLSARNGRCRPVKSGRAGCGGYGVTANFDRAGWSRRAVRAIPEISRPNGNVEPFWNRFSPDRALRHCDGRYRFVLFWLARAGYPRTGHHVVPDDFKRTADMAI